MLKEHLRLMRILAYLIDLATVGLCFILVYFFSFYFRYYYPFDLIPGRTVVPQPVNLDLYLRAWGLAVAIWAVLLKMRGEYSHLRLQTYLRTVERQIINSCLFFGFFTSGAFLLKLHFLSRMFILDYTVACTAFLALNRFLVLAIANRLRKTGHYERNLILIGTGRRAQEFMSLVAKHREWGCRIIGLLDRDPLMKGQKVAGAEVSGTLEDLPVLLEHNVVDEVVFVVPRGWLADIEKCVRYCESVGVPATLSTDFFDLDVASIVPTEIDGLHFLTMETRLLRASELVVKRLMDIIFSGSLLLLSSPVLLAVAIAIKRTSPGPVFFEQVRCSRNGRKFKLYKFRTMVVDAEKRLAELQAKNEMSGPVFKMTNDPRITKIGHFLRKTSLDEFPQLWNVLKGDMSLVGPRPPLPSEVEKYEPWHRRRLSMNPGITCIWQVSGRNEIGFEEWMELDLQYIDKWSLWLDFKIILLTVKAVLTAHGAK